MSVLADFLKQEVKRLEEERPTRDSAIAEWQSAVNNLLRQFKTWIHAADPNEIMALNMTKTTAHEGRLGKYTVTSLSVELDGRSITFEPKARFVGGTIRIDPGQQSHAVDGRIDVLSLDTSEEELYRIGTGDGAYWVCTLRCAGESKYRFEKLTQERFERLLLGLLR